MLSSPRIEKTASCDTVAQIRYVILSLASYLIRVQIQVVFEAWLGPAEGWLLRAEMFLVFCPEEKAVIVLRLEGMNGRMRLLEVEYEDEGEFWSYWRKDKESADGKMRNGKEGKGEMG